MRTSKFSQQQRLEILAKLDTGSTMNELRVTSSNCVKYIILRQI